MHRLSPLTHFSVREGNISTIIGVAIRFMSFIEPLQRLSFVFFNSLPGIIGESNRVLSASIPQSGALPEQAQSLLKIAIFLNLKGFQI